MRARVLVLLCVLCVDGMRHDDEGLLDDATRTHNILLELSTKLSTTLLMLLGAFSPFKKNFFLLVDFSPSPRRGHTLC
uniref:Putative secreted protein n=1 Tax=Psorophora albipes TaxID=869069 RepID=T1DJB5_9DIPT